MKNHLLAVYFVIGLIYGVFGWLFGDYRYQSLFSNLGHGLVWPVEMLRHTPRIDGSSPQAFGQSYMAVGESHTGTGDAMRFTNAFGRITFYVYLKNTPSVSQADYSRMMSGPGGALDMSGDVLQGLMTKPELLAQVAKYADGMTFADIVLSEKDVQKKIDALMATRPAVSAGDLAATPAVEVDPHAVFDSNQQAPAPAPQPAEAQPVRVKDITKIRFLGQPGLEGIRGLRLELATILGIPSFAGCRKIGMELLTIKVSTRWRMPVEFMVLRLGISCQNIVG